MGRQGGRRGENPPDANSPKEDLREAMEKIALNGDHA